MNVAFCINRLAMIGLGVTINSLLKNCSNPKLINYYFFCANLEEEDKFNIRKLFFSYDVDTIQFIDFDSKNEFGFLKSLHGDWTTYGRLLIPDYVQGDYCLYLDADLVVELDILEIDNFYFNNYAIAAVYGSDIIFALEYDFYINEIGYSENTSAFNAGVLYFNLKKWRLENIKQRCLDFGRKYSNNLLSADQTILNGLFAGQFAILPPSFNCAWYCYGYKPTVASKMILHYVGSPKPWDIFAKCFHKGYAEWNSYLTIQWRNKYEQYTLADVKRLWEIKKSYTKLILSALKKKDA
jgi:lipopolysaccharide biosynthesis glycosyltransferase